MPKVTIGLIQAKAHADPAVNLRRAACSVAKAARRGAQVICLQELFRTLYFCRTKNAVNFRLSETIRGPTTDFLSGLARENRVVLIAPVFEKRVEGIYHNSALVIDADGTVLGTYRKMHIPDDPGFYEKFYFAPGDKGFSSFATRYGRIGVMICWDQWFPEAARLTALAGAGILFYPSAIGWHHWETPRARKSQLDAWKIIQRGHAVANGVFVAALNRTGREGALQFWGNSFVADPFGNVLTQLGMKEDILICSCDLSEIDKVRRHWPFLRDRRIDAYHKIARGKTHRGLRFL